MELFLTYIVKYFYFIFIAQVIFVMFMGLKKADSGKRVAALLQSIPFFILFLSARIILDKGYNQYLIFIPIVICVAALILLRKRIFPYNKRCSMCGQDRNWKIVVFSDETVCYDCYNLKSADTPELDNKG